VHVQPESIHKHLSNMHSNGKGGKSVEDQSSRSGHSQTEQQVDPIVPSFSLGLTQELREHPHEDDDEMGENEDQGGGKGNGEVVQAHTHRPTSVAHRLPMWNCVT
ncbi:unnamed protein product, partial [Brassica rapa subsp. narinosa]